MKRRELLVAAFVLVALSRALAGNTIVCPAPGQATTRWTGPNWGLQEPMCPHFTATASPVPITVTGDFIQNQGQVLQEGKNFYGSFLGDFAIGDNLLWTIDYRTALGLQFSAGVSQVGAQVDSMIRVQRTVGIEAYGKGGALLGSCSWWRITKENRTTAPLTSASPKLMVAVTPSRYLRRLGSHV